MPQYQFGMSIAERLKNRSVRSPSGCLLWRGPTTRGYGQTSKNGRLVKVHRVAWELENGPIPEGLFVCHRCDTRNCIEPSHLFLGTPADNNADMNAKGRGVIPFGEKHGSARLSENEVIAIRSDSRPSAILAAIYGVSKRHIRRIRGHAQWRHIRPLASSRATTTS